MWKYERFKLGSVSREPDRYAIIWMAIKSKIKQKILSSADVMQTYTAEPLRRSAVWLERSQRKAEKEKTGN